MKKYIALSATIVLLSTAGCKKYLDEKSDARLAIPTKVQDLLAIMDDYTRINQRDPASPEASADNYYLLAQDYHSQTEPDKRLYTWQKDRIFAEGIGDWSNLYDNVYRANVVLTSIDKATDRDSEVSNYKLAKGAAYFIRGKAFYQAVTTWAAAYREGSAELGIPIRTDPDFNIASVRKGISNSYEQITSDLKNAAELLPNLPAHKIRPSKAAAYGLLSRVCLSMNDYQSAEKYADLCMAITGEILNFNDLRASDNFPVKQFNKEVIFESTAGNSALLTAAIAKIDTQLLSLYSVDDLRRSIFFRSAGNGAFTFKGSFSGSRNLFTGITTGEVILTKAECIARRGDYVSAMQSLSHLLENRYKTGTYIAPVVTSKEAALQIILLERRKELLMRGIRWMDIKRLNIGGASIHLQRAVEGETYTLPANDLRFALPIPEDVIRNSGMPQNPR